VLAAFIRHRYDKLERDADPVQMAFWRGLIPYSLEEGAEQAPNKGKAGYPLSLYIQPLRGETPAAFGINKPCPNRAFRHRPRGPNAETDRIALKIDVIEEIPVCALL